MTERKKERKKKRMKKQQSQQHKPISECNFIDKYQVKKKLLLD
jgi:hypothetical protein